MVEIVDMVERVELVKMQGWFEMVALVELVDFFGIFLVCLFVCKQLKKQTQLCHNRYFFWGAMSNRN